MHLFLVFPSPRSRFASARRALPALYLVAFLPLALGVASSSFPVASAASTLVLASLLMVALFALEWSYRRPATPLARAQLGWVRWGLAVGVAATVVSRLARLLVPEAVPAVVSSVVNLAWLVFPISIALAVLRYRLFDVDRVVRTTIIWGVLVGLLVAAYLVLVVILGRLAVGIFGVSADPTLAVVAVLVFAALGHPLRVRLHSALERTIFRQRFARSHVVEHAGDLLSRPQSPETVARLLCQQVPRVLSLTGGWLTVPAEHAYVFQSDARVLFQAYPSPPRSCSKPCDHSASRCCSRQPKTSRPMPACPRYRPTAGRSATGICRGSRDCTAANRQGELLALWVLGACVSSDLLDREDLSVVARLAGLAEMHLERALSVQPGAVRGRRRHADRARTRGDGPPRARLFEPSNRRGIDHRCTDRRDARRACLAQTSAREPRPGDCLGP